MIWPEIFCHCSLMLGFCFGTIFGQSNCRDSTSRNWIPSNWRILFDSNDYNNLFSGTGSVWIARDVDGDGRSFVQLGSACARYAYMCPINLVVYDTENNWLFSQYIRYASAHAVIYNITYNFNDCSFVTNCHAYVTAYRYDSNSEVDRSAQIDPSNYQYLTGLESTSQFGTWSRFDGFQVREISRSNFTGFYFSIRDSGTCAVVRRVLIYTVVCPAKVSGLVIFPETPVPPQTSDNNTYLGRCAPNSHAVTSLEVEISNVSRVCVERAHGGARCQCDAGYYIWNATTCEACSAGQYRALHQNQTSCNSCPSFTNTTVAATSICECLTGYYRSYKDGPEVDCIYSKLLPTHVTLQPLGYTSDVHNFTVTWNDSMDTTDQYVIDISPNYTESIINQNNTVLEFRVNVIYNMTIYILSNPLNRQHFTLGSCPFLLPSTSLKVLHYNLSSDGHQTVSVVRCDWGREVILMECRDDGEWQSINGADVCTVDLATQPSSFFSAITSATQDSTNTPQRTSPTYLTLISSIAGASTFFCILLGVIMSAVGFLCGVWYHKHKMTKKEMKLRNPSQGAEKEPAIYEEVQLRETQTAIQLHQNNAYGQIHFP